mmetsp:Transcript_40582/g.99774  ORF Transcript_40582/g.99774 Transcript_40582/m.99774 type:complete len:205 (+) Transcript_40582:193-807(+)
MPADSVACQNSSLSSGPARASGAVISAKKVSLGTTTRGGAGAGAASITTAPPFPPSTASPPSPLSSAPLVDASAAHGSPASSTAGSGVSGSNPGGNADVADIIRRTYAPDADASPLLRPEVNCRRNIPSSESNPYRAKCGSSRNVGASTANAYKSITRPGNRVAKYPIKLCDPSAPRPLQLSSRAADSRGSGPTSRFTSAGNSA